MDGSTGVGGEGASVYLLGSAQEVASMEPQGAAVTESTEVAGKTVPLLVIGR